MDAAQHMEFGEMVQANMGWNLYDPTNYLYHHTFYAFFSLSIYPSLDYHFFYTSHIYSTFFVDFIASSYCMHFTFALPSHVHYQSQSKPKPCSISCVYFLINFKLCLFKK